METLLPLFAAPGHAPDLWATLDRLGPTATVVVNIADGPGSGLDPGWTTATARLAAAGVRMLGYVDLALGTRPVREVRAQVRRWTGYPVEGIFFDQVPTSPYLIGPVALAAGTARRADLRRVVLNPGQPPDPLYRVLRTEICVFEGPWQALPATDSDDARPGDGYLVYGVLPAERAAAQALLTDREAGLALVTDGVPPEPYLALPSWLDLAPVG
jgi:hypothetical protein